MKFTDFIENGKDRLAEMFLEKKAVEFAQFEAQETKKGRVAQYFPGLAARVTECEERDAALAETLSCLKNSDVAESIFRRIRSDPGAISNLQNIASQLSGALILKTYTDDILKISAKEISDARAAFSDFKKENGALLKELGLI
jgi:hypothetical protein